MFCKQCDSPDVQKLSLVYENGLTFVDTRTNGAGVGIGRGGLGVGVGSGRTRGTQTTALSAKAAPPAKKKWGGALALTLLMLLLVAFSAWFWIGVLLVGYLVVTNMQYNRNVWPGLMSRWDAAYMCGRCGAIDSPRRGNPTIVSSDGSPQLSSLGDAQLPTSQ